MSSSLSATSIINIVTRGVISIHRKNPSQLSLFSRGLRCQGLNQRFAAGFSTSRHQLHNLQLCHRRPLSSIPKFAAKVTAYEPKNSEAVMPQKFWGETGADLVVEALEREGVTTVFGCSPCLFLTASLERSKSIRTSIQTFLDEGETLAAAVSCARLSSTGLPTVCCVDYINQYWLNEAIVSNTPVVIILISGRRSVYFDSDVPPKCMYCVSEVQDIPKIVKQAFSLASSGPRPGPVVINITSTVTAPTRNDKGLLYNKFKPIVETILDSKKPVLYMENCGCLSRSSEEVRRFLELTGGIPLASSSNSLSSYLRLEHHPHNNNNKNQNQSSHQILGNDFLDYAVCESDLLLAFGVSYDDVLISNILNENKSKKVIHIIEDGEKLSHREQDEKDKKVFPWWYERVYSDVKLALQVLNGILEMKRATSLKNPDISAWREELFTTTSRMVSDSVEEDKAIQPHHVTQILSELTKDIKVRISTNGDIKYEDSIESSEFGWEAAIGAAVVSDPDAIVVHINGFRQEHGLTKPKDLPIKIISLDYHYKYNPQDWTKLLEINEIPSACVTERTELRGAIKKMLDTRGSYLLKVMIQPKPVVPGDKNIGLSVLV